MSTFKHVLNTWLLSHVFHPFLFCLFMLAIGEAVPAEALPILVVAAPIASIPSLMFSWLFLYCLRFNNKSYLLLQGLWLLLVPVAIMLNVLLLFLLAGMPLLCFDTQAYILPSMVAAWVAILARTSQFQHLFTYKTIDNEDSLV